MKAHERDRLAGFLDGELAPDERAEVEAHLATCEECASLLAQMGAVDDLARGVPLEAPSGYFETLPGRVRAGIEAKSRPRKRRELAPARWRLPVWAWAAAAALLLAVVTPLTLPSLYRARIGPPERPVTAAPMPKAIVPAPQSGPERPAPATDAEPAGPAVARAPARGRRAEDRPAEAEPFFAPPPPPAAVPAAPPAPAPEAFAPSEDVAAAAALAESRAPELRKDVVAGAAPAGVVAEGESLEETAPSEPGPMRRQAPMADAMASRAAPVARGETAAQAPKAGATAPQAAERRREGFAAAEATSALDEDAVAFLQLSRDVPGDVAAWREHRERWRSFVADHPESRHVDEARVRVIEAGLEAWRAGGGAEDLARARADAEAYLAREDARQKPRVLRALEEAEGR